MAVLKEKWYRIGMSSSEVTWHTNCDVLEEYYRLFGTCNCPRSSICVLPDRRISRIGLWLRNQRAGRKGTMGKNLPKDREERLQELVDQGKLQWDILDLRDWDFMYNLMVEYGRRHGTCNVPYKWKETLDDGEQVNLGNWVMHQRTTRDSTMTSEHRKRLQELVDQGLFKWRMKE